MKAQRKRKSTRPSASQGGSAEKYSMGLHRTLHCAMQFWECLGTPVALKMAIMCREGMYSDLVRQTVDPRQYLHAADFRKDYAAVKYLAKVKGLIDESILEEVALRSFKAAEDRCASTNLRLTSGVPLWGAEALLCRVREKIHRILGPLDADEVVDLCGWGPGATATLKGADVRPENKILEPRLSVTRRLWPIARAIVSSDLHWCRARLGADVEGPCTLLSTEFQWVEYMRVVTVDKDSKTKRTIGAEPTLNTYVQKGIGKAIRKRLRRVGIDLDDQSRNQRMAMRALRDALATVDLSAASDTISYWLVESLLPPAWFELLDAARSRFALMPDGRLTELRKFSSMGNGYTFELETLIFFAIAQAVTEEVGACTSDVSVYGDDIIVPAAAYGRLTEVFQLFGFSINLDKSYAEGMFFESCGEHFFGGVNVTPVYQKELLDDVPQLVRAGNRLYRWSDRGAGQVRVDDPLTVVRKCLSEAMYWRSHGPHKGSWPSRSMPLVPYGTEGDDGLWSHGLRVNYCPDRGYECVVVRLVANKSDTVSYEALLAITFRRRDVDNPWSDEWRRSRTQALPEVREDLSYQGEVTLRGYSGYKLTRRWVPAWRYRGYAS